MEPISERIVDDITNFLGFLRKINCYRGCVVPDKALRRGRRARSADETKILKHNPRLYQRKTSMVARPIHQDAVAAREMIINGTWNEKQRIKYMEKLFFFTTLY